MGPRSASLFVFVLALSFLMARAASPLGAQAPTRGYVTSLALDAPIRAGADQTITGSGAPDGPGVYVELWRVAAGTARAESVASVEAAGGSFAFDGVDVQGGESYHVTLSRSWRFDADGDPEGWEASVNDALLSVEGGVLRIELENLNGDPFTDAWIQTFFPYDPRYYRVLEVRLKNPAPPAPTNLLGIFWGAPWGTTIAEHNAQIPAEMADFQTILIPLNADEARIVPGPVQGNLDGLWDAGAINDTIRIDPLNNIPPDVRDLDGTVFEIDWIRLREDYRLDFNDDLQGIDVTSDIANFKVEGGFLKYDIADAGNVFQPGPDGFVDPQYLSSLATGRFDTAYFTTAGIGYDNLKLANPVLSPEGVPLMVLGMYFDDRDSVGYWDDGGPPGATVLQYGTALAPAVGRIDGAAPLDGITFDPVAGAANPGEWSEDGNVAVQGFRVDFAEVASEGDHIELDYFAILPGAPYGPSDPVLASVVQPSQIFRRGDANADGQVNISDAITTLGYLFLGNATVGCLDAADSDDTGVVNLTDAVFTLNFLFLGGPAPRPPGPETCSTDPDEDELPECSYPDELCG